MVILYSIKQLEENARMKIPFFAISSRVYVGHFTQWLQKFKGVALYHASALRVDLPVQFRVTFSYSPKYF